MSLRELAIRVNSHQVRFPYLRAESVVRQNDPGMFSRSND